MRLKDIIAVDELRKSLAGAAAEKWADDFLNKRDGFILYERFDGVTYSMDCRYDPTNFDDPDLVLSHPEDMCLACKATLHTEDGRWIVLKDRCGERPTPYEVDENDCPVQKEIRVLVPISLLFWEKSVEITVEVP